MYEVIYRIDGNDSTHLNAGLRDKIPQSWEVGKMVDIAQGRGRYPTFATIITIKKI